MPMPHKKNYKRTYICVFGLNNEYSTSDRVSMAIMVNFKTLIIMMMVYQMHKLPEKSHKEH